MKSSSAILKFTINSTICSLFYYLILFFPLFILFCTSEIAIGQVAPPTDSYLTIDSTESKIFVQLLDTNSISQIEVKIGSQENNDDLFSRTYIFDQTTSLPAGLSYYREGVNVFLGIGTINQVRSYYTKVRLKNISNVWSDWLKYISN